VHSCFGASTVAANDGLFSSGSAFSWGNLVGDYSYLVLDYVDGWTLAEWLEKARPTFKQVARVFMQLVDALDYMHRR
jgi:serine/threonine-protein kinase